MSVESKARQLHAESLKLREQKKFVDSLKLDEEALEAYAIDQDSLGFSELLSMRAKTYLHEYRFTKFSPYLILAQKTAEAAVEIAEESGDISETVLPLFNLGDIREEAGNLDGAVEAYRKTVERMQSNPPQRHNRKSVLANMLIHLTTTEYKTGDKSALPKAEQALADLEASNDANDFELHVWLSGGHMRIAQMLREDNSQKAKLHLQKAKEIIDSDPKLTLRADQWKTLSKSF